MKTCLLCRTSREEKDFYGDELCYKCLYRKKVSISKTNKLCKHCNKPIINDQVVDGKKVATRWKYCSLECAEERAFIMRKNHWSLVARRNVVNMPVGIGDYWTNRHQKENQITK